MPFGWVLYIIGLTVFGDYSKEDTPVPIPNTEVKLFSADGTAWATAWESRTLPKFNIESPSSNEGLFFSIIKNVCAEKGFQP